MPQCAAAPARALHKDLHMRPFGPLALAAVVAALSACASTQSTPEQLAADITALAAAAPALPIAERPAFVSDFDAMRAALPGFDVQRADGAAASMSEVSIIRD